MSAHVPLRNVSPVSLCFSSTEMLVEWDHITVCDGFQHGRTIVNV